MIFLYLFSPTFLFNLIFRKGRHKKKSDSRHDFEEEEEEEEKGDQENNNNNDNGETRKSARARPTRRRAPETLFFKYSRRQKKGTRGEKFGERAEAVSRFILDKDLDNRVGN